MSTDLKKILFPFLKERNISFLYSIIIQLSNSLWAMHQHSLWKLACFYLLEFQSVAFVAPHVPTQHIQNSPPATPKGTLQWKKQQLKMSIFSFAVYPAANYFLPNGSDHTFNPTNQILEYQQLIIQTVGGKNRSATPVLCMKEMKEDNNFCAEFATLLKLAKNIQKDDLILILNFR